jgi:hypothetical protein
VSIRFGALVDSVTLTLSSGESVTAGGAGGGDVSTIHIPEGSQVVGFYGGEPRFAFSTDLPSSLL